MSDASEVKRWQAWVIADEVQRFQPIPEFFVSDEDHDRIVADLRIKIRSLNLEIETRAKPTVEKLKNEITNLKAEIVRLSRPVSAVCTKCGYDKPANLYEQTIARQAKVIEKLKAAIEDVLHERYSDDDVSAAYSDPLMVLLTAIEKEAET